MRFGCLLTLPLAAVRALRSISDCGFRAFIEAGPAPVNLLSAFQQLQPGLATKPVLPGLSLTLRQPEHPPVLRTPGNRPNPPHMTQRQLIVLAVCVGIFALGQFHRASGSVFSPILMDRFGYSPATVAGLVSAMFFATIAVQIPFGSALDRFGPRRILALCMLLVAAGTVVFALTGSYLETLTSRVLIGVGLASMGAATHVIIARNFTPADFGYTSGLVVTLGGVGGLLGTYPLALALAGLPWAAVFGGVAALTLLLAFGVWKGVRPGAGAQTLREEDDTNLGYVHLLKMPEYRAVLVLGLVTFAPITTITGLWGGPYLQDVTGLAPEVAGAILSVFFAASILGGYVFGLLDRHARSRKAVILGGAGVSVAALAGLAIGVGSGTWVPVVLLLLMIFAQQFYIPLGAQMRHAVPDQVLGRASTLFTCLSVAAIPLLQITFGLVLDWAAGLGMAVADQYRAAFGTMGLVIGGCAVIYVLLDRGARHNSPA